MDRFPTLGSFDFLLKKSEKAYLEPFSKFWRTVECDQEISIGRNCEILHPCEGTKPCLPGVGTCEKNLDPVKVQNGTITSNDYDMFTCDCPTAYKILNDDKKCELQDACQPNPCDIGSTCSLEEDPNKPGVKTNKYVCQCRNGRTGMLCNKDVDECLSSPCKNGGTCDNLDNKFECICDNGWSGDTCEDEINHCDSDPCGQHGDCSMQGDAFQCRCLHNYSGKYCNMKPGTACSQQPPVCQNGALCKDQTTAPFFTCTPAPGYTGKYGNETVNYCDSSPCKNGARCVSEFRKYTCECRDGYQGVHCSVKKNLCASNPCKNGGYCMNQASGYWQCDCNRVAFEGDTCETPVDPCSSNPCMNGAQCTNNLRDFQCLCTGKFRGTLCDLVTSDWFGNEFKLIHTQQSGRSFDMSIGSISKYCSL